jgi:hypothetical protein
MKFDPAKLVKLAPPRFVSGKLLTSEELRAEQAYQQQMRWLHNRMLHGYGIVAGLEVLIEEDENAGAQVVVAPGYALDGWGRELIVTEPLRVRLDRERRDLILYLKFVEPADSDDADPKDVSQEAVTDGTAIELLLERPPAERAIAPSGRADFAISLARLRRTHLTWQRDRDFRPPRARP